MKFGMKIMFDFLPVRNILFAHSRSFAACILCITYRGSPLTHTRIQIQTHAHTHVLKYAMYLCAHRQQQNNKES